MIIKKLDIQQFNSKTPMYIWYLSVLMTTQLLMSE
jgi:hypothetical protein